MVSLLVSACGAPVSRPKPYAEGRVGFERDGFGYAAQMRSGTLAISRDGAAWRNDEGLSAKRAGEAFCAGQGGTLNPAAYGHFLVGSWLFQGGCI